MVTAVKGVRAQDGVSYFSKDDYYCNENDKTWWGNGAKELGLQGEIKPENFYNVLNNKDPFDPEKGLTSHQKIKKRVPYTDVTFSPSKSISLIAREDPLVVECHKKAVTSALLELEKNCSLSVKKVQGKKVNEITNNLVIARFNHSENREVEPQLHTHCVIANVTKCNDDKWRTVENKKIFENQKFLDSIYNAELTYQLHLLGYETRKATRLDSSGKPISAIEIKGISDKTIEEFSTRFTQVKEEQAGLEKIHEEKKGSTASSAEKRVILNRAKKNTRAGKNRSDVDEIRDIINKKITENEEIQITIASKGTVLNKNFIDPSHVMLDVVKDLEENEAVSSRKEILQLALKRSLNTNRTIEDYEIQLDCHFKCIGDDMYSSLNMNRAFERSKTITENGQFKSRTLVHQDTAEKYLEVEESNGVVFKESQRNMIKQVTTSLDRVNLIQGDAGTGKTFAVEHVKKIFENEGYTLRGLAPTGKASQELRSTGIDSSTISSFLLKKQKLKPGEVWVVDEASMIGSLSMHKLLEKAEEVDAKVLLIGDTKQLQSVAAGKAFEELQKYSGVETIYMDERIRQKTDTAKKIVSSANKRDSIGAVRTMVQEGIIEEESSRDKLQKKAVADYLSSSEKQSTVLLCQTNVSRVISNDMIRNDKIRSGKVEEGYQFGVFVPKNVSAVEKRHCESYKKGMFLICNDMVGRIASGTYVEVQHVHPEEDCITVKYCKKNGKWTSKKIDLMFDGDKLQTYTREDRNFGIGDEVVFLKNDKELNVTNGDTGVVKGVDKDGNLQVKINGRKTVLKEIDKQIVDTNIVNFNVKNNYQHIDHGYALTNYKSQGATYDKAILLTEDASRTNSNEWYVGLTRAKYEISAYVNSIEDLKVFAGLAQEKRSIPEFLNEKEQQIDQCKVISKNDKKKSLKLDEFRYFRDRKSGRDCYERKGNVGENTVYVVKENEKYVIKVPKDTKYVTIAKTVDFEKAKKHARENAIILKEVPRVPKVNSVAIESSEEDKGHSMDF